MFKKAIVRVPGKSMVKGISTANLGKPDYDKALDQHAKYIEALKSCGLDITVLPAAEDYPDSCFVEDIALLTPNVGIITNPGAESRRGEVEEMKEVLKGFYDDIEEIKDPGTVEAGDIMMVEDHYYVGLSERTNLKGALQLIAILKKYELTGAMVNFSEVLHLKTGLSYLEEGNLLVCGEFVSNPTFEEFIRIEVPSNEAYAANCIWVNNRVLIPSGYPITSLKIKDAGYDIIELDMSEFQKLDGGLSCLSLRF